MVVPVPLLPVGALWFTYVSVSAVLVGGVAGRDPVRVALRHGCPIRADRPRGPTETCGKAWHESEESDRTGRGHPEEPPASSVAHRSESGRAPTGVGARPHLTNRRRRRGRRSR